jgi:hypothetical protein
VVLEAQGIRPMPCKGVLMGDNQEKGKEEVFQDGPVVINQENAKANEEWKKRDMPWGYGPA